MDFLNQGTAMLKRYNQSTQCLVSGLLLNRTFTPSAGGTPLRTSLVRHNVETTYVVPGDWPKADGEAWFHDGMAPTAGSDVEYLIDGQQTFDAMLEAMETATKQGHYILLLGWGLDVNFAMAQGKSFLQIVEERATLNVAVRVLLWENVGSQVFDAKAKLNALRTTKSLDVSCYLDDNTNSPIPGYFPDMDQLPFADKIPFSTIYKKIALKAGHPGLHSLGSHHQKILLVYGNEGLVGFCGGVDIDENRLWYLHDVHVRLTGDAPKELLKIAEQRWSNAKDDDVPPTPATISILSPAEFPIPIRARHLARVMQTVGNPDVVGVPNTVWSAVLRGIRRASRYIYIEDQYFWSYDLIYALIEASARVKHITIVLPDILLTEYPVMVQRTMHELLERGGKGIERRIGVFARKPGARAWIHAKMFVFDDEYAIVGSANANNRGYFHDSEVSAGIAERDWSNPDGTRGGEWSTIEANFARRMRMNLWAEHLGLAPDELFDGVAARAHWETPLPTTARVGVFEAADLRSWVVLKPTFEEEVRAWKAGQYRQPAPVEPWCRLPWWEAPYDEWYPEDWASPGKFKVSPDGSTVLAGVQAPSRKSTRDPLMATVLDPKGRT